MANKNKRKPLPKKPRPLRRGDIFIARASTPTEEATIWDSRVRDADDARRLAAWLLKFADWAEARNAK